MEKLNINTFISAAADSEMSQYLVLANLKNYIDHFHKNKLYPPFGELVELNHNLNSLRNKRTDISGRLPSKILGFDFHEKKLVYEKEDLTEKDMGKVFEFIEWALPKIKEGLDEGKAIYDFVDENIEIEEIGIHPLYNQEGYFIIPNIIKNEYKVFKFELSIITSSDIPLRSMKTNYLETFETDISELSVDNIKLELIKKYPELPNPATYNLVINIDFPFDETVLPIAKRKLMRKLAA